MSLAWLKGGSMGNIKTLPEDFLKLLEEQAKHHLPPDLKRNRIAHAVNSGSGVNRIDLERMVGDNDLVYTTYLERALLAVKAVCRIYVPPQVGFDGNWGTGFLVSPNLLLTNHHVIGSFQQAQAAIIEFGYELDLTGMPKISSRFRLRPDLGFITSTNPDVDPQSLDYSLIAIEDTSENGATSLSQFGFLRCNPNLGKVEAFEYVSIIQHPNKEPKCLAIRENKVVKIGDKDPKKDAFIWYMSDTAPGSSGAPVFNDDWQVIALHHSAVPASRGKGKKEEIQLLNGTWVPKEQLKLSDQDKIKYVGNEGIRISKVVADIVQQYQGTSKGVANTKFIKALIEDSEGIQTFPNVRTGTSIESVAENSSPLERVSSKVHGADYFKGRTGYNPRFLKTPLNLPKLTAKAQKFGAAAELIGSKETELKYTHFSVVLNAERKVAFFTAVNIDGSQWGTLGRETDVWFYDGRVSLDAQMGNEFYENEPQNWFDKGHLVRRLDPVWGTEEVALLANEDTFHWSNCCPQHWRFNRGKQLWQGLENYILYNTDQENVKATVFSGPVFSLDDQKHRGTAIPKAYWKIVAVEDSQEKLYSSAYIVSQEQYATGIAFEALPVEKYNTFQTTVAKIQALTGLKFPKALTDRDVMGKNSDRKLRSLADLQDISRRS